MYSQLEKRNPLEILIRRLTVRQHLPLPGIIGGAGPIATTQLYLDIVSRCRHACLDRRPPVLIASMRIDLRMEQRLLQTGEGIESYLEPLLEAAKALEEAGADFLAIPCNTLHLLLPALVSASRLPVVSIVDAVVEEVERTGFRRVGLLATEATMRTGLFQAGMQASGIEVVNLDNHRQQTLLERIRGEVDQGETWPGDHTGNDIINFFRSHGVEALVAGCTELKAVMVGWSNTLPVIDSLDALGAAVVRKMLSTEKGNSNKMP